MKTIYHILLAVFLLHACAGKVEDAAVQKQNWQKRTVANLPEDSLTRGTTYLSVYSQIYSQTEHRKHDLTATVSMRNTNRADTVYITKAEYFDTGGKLLRTYFDRPIFIVPMETLEIILGERDPHGGSGANFLFDWATKPGANEPYFEAVMISTSGQQGLSFMTQGKRVK
jgi:hypothetical protein